MQIRNQFLLLLLTSFTLSTATATAADDTKISGTLTYKHQEEVADASVDPAATSVGQFFHDYVRGVPGQLTTIPIKEIVLLKVRKSNGETIEVIQDWKDGWGLAVGDNVMIEQIDGTAKVIKAD